jgi:hypothetical protein
MRLVLILILAFFVSPDAGAQSVQWACTAWGGSHTGRYTFDIDPGKCRIYWREIDTELDVQVCEPPRLKAQKPFAPAKGYVLKFNLETGSFSDHVPGWADRGSCERAKE